ncbi:MAG: hypothetical protein J6S40_06855 [Thermoguttaceae bacterium]|nr:hypothetical protein [Thermoguttaceae bacterium]
MTDENRDITAEAKSSDDEQLTAFIDGELSDADRAEVVERLASDPALRVLYEKLRAVDDYLSRIEPESVSPDLTTRTMELVTQEVRKDYRAARTRSRLFSLLFFLFQAALAVGAFFAAERYFHWRDYTVYSRLDALEAVGTLSFLKELSKNPFFGDGEPLSLERDEIAPSDQEPADAPPGASPSAAGTGQDESLVPPTAELNPDDLFLRRIRFQSLSPELRRKYRCLCRAISNEPDAERLNQTLIRFGNWFSERLTESQRNRFRSETDEENRLARVEQLLLEPRPRSRPGNRLVRFSGSPTPPSDSPIADLAGVMRNLSGKEREEFFSLPTRSMYGTLLDFYHRYKTGEGGRSPASTKRFGQED